MYSIVLMSALATGGDTPSFGWRSGCVGASCSGVVVSSCTGCTGYAAPVGCCGGTAVASGCCGGRGGLFPLFPNLRSRIGGLFSRGCNGCGGCTGYAVSSCHGSCYGSSCLGSSCYGASCLGSSSYHMPTLGYNFAGMPTFSQGYSMGGCFGTGVVGPYYYGADYNNPPTIVVPPMTAPGVPLSRQGDAREFLASRATPTPAAPARLTVELPADAVLFVDGEKVSGTGPVRNFHTPTLPEGTFFYDLKAEVTVDGEVVAESVRVLVKAGDAKTESFGKLFAAVKAAKNPAVVSK